METLIFDPLVPTRWLIAGWIALPIVVLGYAVWRGPVMGWRRVVLALGHAVPLAVLLFLLYGPTWRSVGTDTRRRPPLLVLVDRSASMTADAAPGEKGSRYEQALRIVQQGRSRWRRSFKVDYAVFDRSLQPVAHSTLQSTASPDGVLTDLATAIDGGLQGGSPPETMLLLSDGIHNTEDDPLESARRARAIGCPIYTVTLGSDTSVEDLGVVLADRDGLTLVRQPYRALVTVTHRGVQNVQAKLVVRQGKNVVEQRDIPITGTSDINLDVLLMQEKSGTYDYQFSITQRPGEVFQSNNLERLTLRVVDERLRVLVLEGKPYWDNKFLVQALERDANIVVTSLVRVTPNRVIVKASGGSGEGRITPNNLEQPLEDTSFLEAHQVVVLGRDVESFFSQKAVDNLRYWVGRQGGHIICSRGRPTLKEASLLELFPVVWTPNEEQQFHMELTERGRMTALFSSAPLEDTGGTAPVEEDPRTFLKLLPTLVTASRVEKERALAVVLARAEGRGSVSEMATLSYQQSGAGRVVVIEGQGLWRWAFQPPGSSASEEAIFETFWSNIVRWLVGSNDFLPSQQLKVRVGKSNYSIDERPALYLLDRTARVEKTPVEAVLEVSRDDPEPVDDSGLSALEFPLRVKVAPFRGDESLRRALLEPLPAGRYRVKLLGQGGDRKVDSEAVAAAVEATFTVSPPLKERLDLRARPQLLRRIAEMSDGAALPATEATRLDQHYGDYVARFRPGQEKRTPAWDRFWIWGALIAWLGLLWLLRRRWAAI